MLVWSFSKNDLILLEVSSSRLLGSYLCEHGRHAPDDPPDAGRALPQRPALSDEVDQPVEHQQDAVVRLRRRHLEEGAALGQSEQPALLAGDAAMAAKVPFVPHDDDGDGRLPAASDLLQPLPDCVKAATVADTVDQDDPVGPLQLLVTDGPTLLTDLMEQNFIYYLTVLLQFL